MDEKTDLKKFFTILKRRKLTVLITMLMTFALTACVSFFVMKPTYEATANIVVGKLKKEEGYYGETQEIYMLLASTKDFIKSPTVLNSVQKELGFTDSKLEEKIVVQNNKDSQIVSVVVRDQNPERTQNLTVAIVNTTVNKMKEIFGVSEIKVLASPEDSVGVERVGSAALNLAIGGIVGLFLGICLAMFREYWDDSFKDAKEVEEILGLQVLGSVDLKDYKKKTKNESKIKAAKILKEKKGGEVSA
ncbi:Wzz/FepE/Etk N-terminal domain-containing protein [Bacillus sp. FJAT-27251]|uniref:YveK family protein n=1 Tax=Bacillus sp. FJAT-27251 TaxID=1684142 RepID=UPI0006A7E1B5|nr:Wzz/FepE/Etk N-terminal domain-containing protein [Bacillus sp. FJAT-27251]